jgi:hypothetical protein
MDSSPIPSIVVSVAALAIVGCTDNMRLELSATALSKAADECLYDVRDRRMKYEKSPNCVSLGTLATQYIEAGGFRPETPSKYELIAEKARRVAWVALATSESGNRPLRIW